MSASAKKDEVVNFSDVRRLHHAEMDERRRRQIQYSKIEALKGRYSKKDYDKLIATPPEEWEERYDDHERMYYLFFYKVVTDPPNILKLDIDEVDRQMLAAYRAADKESRKEWDDMLNRFNVEIPL